MAGVEVDVQVTDASIIAACNTPGGPVYEWRDQLARRIVIAATVLAPVNKALDAVHRNGVRGTFARSFGWERGGGGHHVIATMYNTADHAEFVEFDTDVRLGHQRFSWARWKGAPFSPPFSPGQIGSVNRTGGRQGKHVLKRATNAMCAQEGLGGI